MPLYDHRCRECGAVFEAFARIDEREVSCVCDGKADRILSSRYYVHPDINFVTDNLTGEPVRVDSRKKLRRLLAENGLYEKVGKGWH